jgi:hypothetical protein
MDCRDGPGSDTSGPSPLGDLMGEILGDAANRLARPVRRDGFHVYRPAGP